MPSPITQKNLPSIVQFPHPGSEAKPDKTGNKPWSHTLHPNGKNNPHTRKFALNAGKYLPDLNSKLIEDKDMMFWCEWEPESTVINTFTKTSAEHPQYLYKLWWQSKPCYKGLHNTDPFIFEQSFKYYNCKQKKKMKNLAPNSVILFGSKLKGRFVLDTVFVVGKSVSYTVANYHHELSKAGISFSTTFDSVCMLPTGKPQEATLYEGVRYKDRADHNNLFSYFPCLPYEQDKSFARPEIKIDSNVLSTQILAGVFHPKLGQGIKITIDKSIDDCVEVWNEVVRQVTAQGLCLGIEATTPPQKHSNLPPKPNSQPSTSSTKC